MPKKTPTLTAPTTVGVGAPFGVSGEDFPKNTAVFIITNQVAPIFRGDQPSLLVETDAAGALEVTNNLTEAGTYVISATVHSKKRGGSWDNRSVTPITVEAV